MSETTLRTSVQPADGYGEHGGVATERTDHIPTTWYAQRSPEEAAMSEDELLLHRLDEALEEEPSYESFLESATGVAQKFAEAELLEASPESERLQAVLDTTKRPDLTVQRFVLFSDEAEAATYYYRDSTTGVAELQVNKSGGKERTEEYAQIFRLAGVEPIHSNDAVLLKWLHGLGHEKGHERDDAVSILLAEQTELPVNAQNDYPSLAGNYVYDHLHPGKGIDPHPRVSVRAREEASAEGNGTLAARRFLKVRGYSPGQTAAILDRLHSRMLGATILNEGLDAERHQIDFLGKPDEMQAYFDDGGSVEDAGKLGYGRWLSAQEIAESLVELGELATGKTSMDAIMAGNRRRRWRSRLDLTTADYIAYLKDSRRQALAAKKQ